MTAPTWNRNFQEDAGLEVPNVFLSESNLTKILSKSVTEVNKLAPDLKDIPETVISGFQLGRDGTGKEGQNLEKR